MAEKQAKKAEKPDFKITIEVLNPDFLKDGDEKELIIPASGYILAAVEGDGVKTYVHGEAHPEYYARGIISIMERCKGLGYLLDALIEHVVEDKLNDIMNKAFMGSIIGAIVTKKLDKMKFNED